MLSLKDIHRHFGMRKTHEVLVRISHRHVLPSGVLPVVEDLAYIGLVRRRSEGAWELTDAGAAALTELDETCGHLLMHDQRIATAVPELA
ncbi:MAG TPA: hypothetical protein VNA88_12320 [Candidatus Kapabacteria bacterium]|jgi:hypothetical protein|nr:hypothetical protein [Candidatus Kapabacteria bacterium]